METLHTIIFDPHTLITISATLFAGAILSYGQIRLAICDHLLPENFLASDFVLINNIIANQNITQLSVSALEMQDLMHMGKALTTNQIATIAAARSHGSLLASDCKVVHSLACKILKPKHVIGSEELYKRFAA